MSNKKFVPGSSKIKEIENKQPVKNFLRLAVGQGFGFGFGDEIEASFRSAFSEKSMKKLQNKSEMKLMNIELKTQPLQYHKKLQEA